MNIYIIKLKKIMKQVKKKQKKSEAVTEIKVFKDKKLKLLQQCF